jgi:hypothetical protein
LNGFQQDVYPFTITQGPGMYYLSVQLPAPAIDEHLPAIGKNSIDFHMLNTYIRAGFTIDHRLRQVSALLMEVIEASQR